MPPDHAKRPRAPAPTARKATPVPSQSAQPPAVESGQPSPLNFGSVHRPGPTPTAAAHAPCACGGTCPRCVGTSPVLARQDFSAVRVHPSAPEVTAPLQARAVTIGQDIYFNPGEYRPGTPEGDGLMAHELAHTLQTRGAETDSAEPQPTPAPDQAVEQNADALAAGVTTHIERAAGNAPLRTPFDNETAEQRTRRQTLIQSIGNASTTLIDLLRTGGLLQRDEVVVERNGVRGVVVPAHTAGTPNEFFSSYAQRDARVRRIIRFLQAMTTQYRTTPIATGFAPPVLDETAPPHYHSDVTYTTPQGTVRESYSSRSPAWTDLQAAYMRYLVAQGLTGPEYEWDWFYLDPSSTVIPGAARGAPRARGGIQTGTYMIVPDIEHDPLRYWRLTGTALQPDGSVIVELWHDDFGYYYLHNGQRVDVPSPWERPR